MRILSSSLMVVCLSLGIAGCKEFVQMDRANQRWEVLSPNQWIVRSFTGGPVTETDQKSLSFYIRGGKGTYFQYVFEVIDGKRYGWVECTSDVFRTISDSTYSFSARRGSLGFSAFLYVDSQLAADILKKTDQYAKSLTSNEALRELGDLSNLIKCKGALKPGLS